MRCEIAVIGSGPGGAITAFYLARAGRDVLLIEEGVSEQTPSFSLQELKSKYRNAGQTVAFGSPRIQYVEGCCLGGGSEINSGLYHRLPESIREEWQKRLGIKHFSPADLEPHYRACEELFSVQTVPAALTKASIKLLEGGLKLGWEVRETPRWFGKDNVRRSMSTTLIPAFVAAGGKVLSGTKVTRLEKQGRGWRLRASGAEIRADVVFVCAGAIQTPFLLRRSGIKRSIGNALALHPTVKLTARFEEEINDGCAEIPVHQVQEFSPHMLLGGSVSTRAHLMAAFASHPSLLPWVLQNWRHLFVYYGMVSPQVRGKVRSLFGSPYVSYHLQEEERRMLATAQKRLAEVLIASGARELVTGTGMSVTHPHELPGVLAKDTAGLMTIHLCGSCPMGEDRSLSATNSFGKVHGFDNLYVSDASLLGGSPGVNPQGAIMAICRRNVLHFLGKNG